MAALSDYLENKLIDHVMRGQAYTAPTTLHCALLTAAPGEAGGGTEVSGGGYGRVAVAASLANWAGTQGAGTTVASSGASGTTSNNVAISFPTPSAGWGTVSHAAVYDAPTGGNLLWYSALGVSKTINSGDSVSFPAGTFSLQIDN